jgi:hypothetical protein
MATPKAAERKRIFERDERTRRLQLASGAGLLVIATFLLVVLFGGEYTQTIREELGLSALLANEDGVYADCSIAANRGNKFCRHDYSRVSGRSNRSSKSQGGYGRPDDSLPFSLHGQ